MRLTDLALKKHSRVSRDASLPVTIALVVFGLAVFAWGLGYTLASREAMSARRAHAIEARTDIDQLQELYLRTNADFLQGFGTTRVASFAWPVERVGAALASFRRLEASYAGESGAATIQALRQETARWAWLLAEITVTAHVADGRASVDSAKLLEANRLLARMEGQLTTLRDGQTRILRSMADTASKNEAIEGAVLAFSALLGCALLGYALLGRYRARLERHSVHLAAARRDALTDLPNRVTLRELMEQAVSRREEFALLFIDLDRFKDINDSLGHGAGDRLLREVAQRLAGCIGEHGVVTRYGGDEFVAMLKGPHQDGRLTRLLSDIARAFESPVQIDDVQLRVQSSIGVACFPDDAPDAESLLKHADLAMYRAKARGRDAVERFNPSFADAADRRIKLSQRLRLALESDAFELVYQPQIDLRTYEVTGVEALLRWNDPEMGPVSPATFIPITEDIGLIGQLGEWVLHTACKQAKRWSNDHPALGVSVNVSPRQLGRGDFCEVVRRALNGCGLAAHRLELEITEGAMLAPGSVSTLRTLKDIGVAIAIDDFGTGYSSLSYLRTFQADRLKIDMSFIRGIGSNRADETIIRAILALARRLDFEVVAEGVERPDQLAFVAADGCRFVQGYHFCPPLPAADIPAFIENFKSGLHAPPSLHSSAK